MLGGSRSERFGINCKTTELMKIILFEGEPITQIQPESQHWPFPLSTGDASKAIRFTDEEAEDFMKTIRRSQHYLFSTEETK